MKLLVDLGNTRPKWACQHEDGSLEGPYGMCGAVAAEFEAAWARLAPQEAIYCSVASADVTRALRAWIEARWPLEVWEVRAQARAGEVRNAYRDPAALGDDRWANLLGARALLGELDAIIVDAGTAVTVDGLRADGRHVGGAIYAGLAAARAGLAHAAPALPDPEAASTTALPARDSTTAVAGGTWAAQVGACEHVAREVAAKLNDPVYLLTGGNAEALAARLGSRWRHDPLLTMRGLVAARESQCAG
ncbi:MAG: type III pantothenate kinase [Halofilum sp. (in: g-proteobacteria)]